VSFNDKNTGGAAARVTVLAKYQRLEAEGVWRPDHESQRRDVIVSIGDATLTLSASNGTPLTHWSLPAILRTNTGKRPAIYAPGDDTDETLEISDDTMIDGIDQVLMAIQRGAARPGRLRGAMVAAGVVAGLLVLVLWLPGAITRYTAGLVPAEARAAIGRELMDQVRRVGGAPCAAPAGLRSLAGLEARLFPAGGVQLAVLPSALGETAHLPGGIILIGRGLVEDFETPEVLAGYVLAEDLRRKSRDPMERLLSDAGLAAALKVLTSGRLPDGTLARYSERLIAARPEPVPDEALLDRLAEARVASAPYAYARDISGESTLPLIEALQSDSSTPEILSDGNWIALQRICEG
jgi:hypothetical protein